MSTNMTENNVATQNNQNNTIIADENSPNTFCFEEKMRSQNLEELNINALNSLYTREDSFFKKNIDKLNQKFYAETNKYLTIKAELEKSHDSLFCILFKQISHYIEEIDKLNSRLKERDENVKFYKNRVDEINKKEYSEKDITYYKTTIRNLEKRMNDKLIAEEKLKKENESFKRQVNFYKEKLKVDYINPIKKMDLNCISNINTNTNSKLMSPFKYAKPANNSSNNTTINKPLHRKKISNNNVTSNFLNENDCKKDEIANVNQDLMNDRKRVSSMDVKKKDVSTKENNITISINTVDKKEDSLNSGSRMFKKDANDIILLTHSTLHQKKEKSINIRRNITPNKNTESCLKKNSFILSNKLNKHFNKHIDEKIVQNNCQNIYNLNINPLEDRPKTPQKLEDVNEIFSMIASNLDDELNLLKNEEIYLKLLKEDLNGNDTESSMQLREANSSSVNIHNNPLSENYLSVSSDNNKEVNISLIEDISSNKNYLENDFRKVCLHTDIGNKITNFSLKNDNVKFGSKFKNNTNSNNLSIKNKTNVEKGEKTPNKTPNKIKSNFSFASKYTNTNVLKSTVQSKDAKKN